MNSGTLTGLLVIFRGFIAKNALTSAACFGGVDRTQPGRWRAAPPGGAAAAGVADGFGVAAVGPADGVPRRAAPATLRQGGGVGLDDPGGPGPGRGPRVPAVTAIVAATAARTVTAAARVDRRRRNGRRGEVRWDIEASRSRSVWGSPNFRYG